METNMTAKRGILAMLAALALAAAPALARILHQDPRGRYGTADIQTAIALASPGRLLRKVVRPPVHELHLPRQSG
jgi:hypothetical protein